MKKYKTGLVLSGGGTRGFAHLGVIAALYEKGIKPDVIAGTSAGSIVGAFIASGKTPEEILAIFKKGWFFSYTKLQLPVDGLMKLDGLKEVIQKNIGTKNIEDLKIPFFITVSNLNLGTVEYRNKGNLSKAILASSSIPVIFSPVELDGNLYVDGGLMDNIPVEPIKNDCEKIIVSNISPLNPKENLKNLIQITSRTFYMTVNANMKAVQQHADLFIEPEGIDNYDILSLSHADELYELGYRSTKKILEQSVPDTVK
jgi:NTE family protein